MFLESLVGGVVEDMLLAGGGGAWVAWRMVSNHFAEGISTRRISRCLLAGEHPENFDSPGLARDAEGLSGGCRQRSEGCPARPQPASRAALVADISSSAHEALSIDGKHLILIFTRSTRGGEGPARALMHHNQCA